MSDRQAVGIDIGGTKIAAARISAEGEIRAGTVTTTPANDQSAALPAIEVAAAEVMDDGVVAIGIGMAGLIDVRSGTLLSTPNLVWRDLPLGEGLRAKYGLPVTVMLETRAHLEYLVRRNSARRVDEPERVSYAAAG